MKKTYINPQIEIVKVPATQLLAGSDPKLSTSAFNSSSETVLGREFDFDDED